MKPFHWNPPKQYAFFHFHWIQTNKQKSPENKNQHKFNRQHSFHYSSLLFLLSRIASHRTINNNFKWKFWILNEQICFCWFSFFFQIDLLIAFVLFNRHVFLLIISLFTATIAFYRAFVSSEKLLCTSFALHTRPCDVFPNTAHARTHIIKWKEKRREKVLCN